MSVQQRPDRQGSIRNVDNKSVQWEEDLKPFTRLPRQARPEAPRRSPVIIPALVSFALSLFVCGVAATLINRNLPQIPQLSILGQPQSTATRPQATASPTLRVPATATPYVAPTISPTPAPTPFPTPAQGQIGVGTFVRVVETGPDGLNFRKDPARTGQRLRGLPEGGVYPVVGGPVQADGITWFQLRDKDGMVGWGSSAFLRLAPKP
jgi:hypothetical protein